MAPSVLGSQGFGKVQVRARKSKYSRTRDSNPQFTFATRNSKAKTLSAPKLFGLSYSRSHRAFMSTRLPWNDLLSFFRSSPVIRQSLSLFSFGRRLYSRRHGPLIIGCLVVFCIVRSYLYLPLVRDVDGTTFEIRRWDGDLCGGSR